MGNLGAYQDIVVRAKDAGGVEKLIESIEASAALKAMPKSFAAGAATALVAVAAAKQYSKRIKAREAEADEAKVRLVGIVEEDSAAHDAPAEDTRDDATGAANPDGTEQHS